MQKDKVYIRSKDTLEFVYKQSEKWKNIKGMKEDLMRMISILKAKYDRLKEEFNLKI